MNHLLRKFEFQRLIVAALAAFACISMWGCGETYYDWDDRRSSRRVVGFVDDSLVMVGDIRCWTKYEETILAMSDEDIGSGCGHTRLCVYNYRVQEDGPRWCDSLDNTRDESTLIGQMTDSIVWGGNVPESIKMWKLGEKPYERKLRKIVEGCSVVFKASSVKQWYDKSFIVRGGNSLNAGGDSCQYAVLDTIQGIITYKRLDDNLEWIKKCDDVRVWSNDVYCFMPGEHAFEAVLLRNRIDTIDVPVKFTVGDFWGNVLHPNADLCNLVDGDVICSGAIWRGGLSFYQNEEIVVDLE